MREPWIIQVEVMNSNKGVLMKKEEGGEKERRTHRHRGEDHVQTDTEAGVIEPHSK